MRVTRTLTKTRRYTYILHTLTHHTQHTCIRTPSLSVCPRVRVSVCLSLSHLLASKAACCNAPPIRSSLLHMIQMPMCVNIMSRVRDLCEHRCVCVCVCVCVFLQAYTNPCTHATFTKPAPIIDTINTSAATRAQRCLKPILQQLEPPFHAPPSRPAQTRARTHFSSLRHGTCKRRGHSTQE